MEKESGYRLLLTIAFLAAAAFGFRAVMQYQPGDVGGATSGTTGTLTGKIQISAASDFIRDPAAPACKDSTEAAGFVVSYEGPVSGTTLPDKCGPRGPQYSVSGLPLGKYKLSVAVPPGWKLLSAPSEVEVFAEYEAMAGHFLVNKVRGVPAAPTGLRAQCADTGSEVILSWGKTSGADSYNLRVDRVSNNSDAADGGWFVSTPPDLRVDEVQSPYTFGITHGQRYRFWAHGVSTGGAGVQSESQSFICSTASAGPLVTVVSPNGRESFKPGQTVQIRWEQANADRVSLAYKSCPACLGFLVTDLPADLGAAEGSYSWTIPRSFPLGVDYQIYIVAYKTGFGQASVLSDATFSVVAP